MHVNTNNSFNTDEERVQYAIGAMQAYTIEYLFGVGDTFSGGANYPGIISLSPEDALIKFLKQTSKVADNMDHTYRVKLCE